LLKKLAKELQPDIIALQETKCPDEAFPVKELRKMGFDHLHYHGMKSYNGVAFLSKIPFLETQKHDRVEKKDCRHIAVTIQSGKKEIHLHNLYIPAGGDIPDRALNEKFAHKLDFVHELASFFPSLHKKDTSIIACGDFNIAPLENDVWSHKQLLDVVSHTPIEVSHLDQFSKSFSWIDVARHFVPHTQKLYSWWSYRNNDWEKSNRGRRLDHIWVTPALKKHLQDFSVHSAARNWERPSDHVPVVADFVF
jgi:exodeoxyribonuclease-3